MNFIKCKLTLSFSDFNQTNFQFNIKKKLNTKISKKFHFFLKKIMTSLTKNNEKEEKKILTKRYKVKHAFEEFLDATSLHGIGNLLRHKHSPLKQLVWLFCFVALASLCCWLTLRNVSNYFDVVLDSENFDKVLPDEDGVFELFSGGSDDEDTELELNKGFSQQTIHHSKTDKAHSSPSPLPVTSRQALPDKVDFFSCMLHTILYWQYVTNIHPGL